MSVERRVLVTGANGFIGRQSLSPLLRRGFAVHAVSRNTPPAGYPQGTVAHCADLLNPVSRAALIADVQPTDLLHFAWYVAHGKFWEAPENLDWTAASLALLREFASAGGTRAVLASSCAEYDWACDICREDSTPLNPRTLYGRCKLALHIISNGFARTTGLSVANGRVFFLYGPHEAATRLVPSVIRAVLRGEPALCTHGRQVRDFLHVHDAGAAFAALLDSQVEGAVNIAGGEPHPVSDIANTIGEILGRPELIRLGAIPFDASEPLRLCADVTRLREEVGFTPSFTLREGLKQTVDWWKARFS